MVERRRLSAFVLATLLVVAVILAASWWARPTGPPALLPGWDAVARVIAGDGTFGVADGAAADARFSDPFGVATAPDGTIYVTDAGEAQRVRRLTTDGIVTTVAGGGRGFEDGRDGAARFDTPSALAIDAAGVIYVADTGNNAIRRIDPAGLVSTLAGDGVAGDRDGPAARARFNGPVGLAVDRLGRLIVADTYNDRIRMITPDGQVRTLAGSGVVGAQDGAGPEASFDTPCGVAVDAMGVIFVADTGNGLVRRIATDGFVTTVMGESAFGEGPQVFAPIGIAVSPSGFLYVTDRRGRIVEIAPDHRRRTLAGSTPGFADGSGAEARFRNPTGVAVAREGQVIVADAGNALVRELGARSRLAFRAPAAPRVRPAFDAEAFARLPLLWPVEPMGGPHEIAGTFGEARGDPGGSGSDRFHAGIDVRERAGTPVLAVRDAVVQSPVAAGGFGTLGEWISIGPIAYVHVRVGRDATQRLVDPSRFASVRGEAGELARVRVKRGTRFSTGDVIGTVNPFNHVHLNIGWSGEERNPLLFRLPSLRDTVAPIMARGGIRLYDEHGRPFERRRKGPFVVSGRVLVTVEAWDQMDGGTKRRRLGLYRLGYQVLRRDGTPAPGFESPLETIRFDRLAADADAPHVVYAPGSGIPFYGSRVTRFVYSVTSTFRGGLAEAGAWDTSALAPGDYVLRVLAADAFGNEARVNTEVPVTVVPAPSE